MIAKDVARKIVAKWRDRLDGNLIQQDETILLPGMGRSYIEIEGRVWRMSIDRCDGTSLRLIGVIVSIDDRGGMVEVCLDCGHYDCCSLCMRVSE